MDKRYIDPETFNVGDIKYLLENIEDKFSELFSAINDLGFMLEESPNKFKYLEVDVRYLRQELLEAYKNSSLRDDVEELIKEAENEDN